MTRDRGPDVSVHVSMCLGREWLEVLWSIVTAVVVDVVDVVAGWDGPVVLLPDRAVLPDSTEAVSDADVRNVPVPVAAGVLAPLDAIDVLAWCDSSAHVISVSRVVSSASGTQPRSREKTG